MDIYMWIVTPKAAKTSLLYLILFTTINFFSSFAFPLFLFYFIFFLVFSSHFIFLRPSFSSFSFFFCLFCFIYFYFFVVVR